MATTSSLTFDGPGLAEDSGVFPPDTMGDVGPSQFIVAINSRIRSYGKATGTADGRIDILENDFWASEMTPAACNFTSDPHIRYDRLTQRWIIIIIDVPGCAGSVSNRVLIAASDGPTVSASTVWTFHHFNAPATLFADYPTLGVDANALYIGTNDFTFAGAFARTDGYVVRKSSIFSAGPIVVTPFTGLATGTGAGPFTPQGVDNPDPSATVGYLIGVDNASFGQLDIRRVTSPGGTPTLSGNLTVPVAPTEFPLSVPHRDRTGGANGNLDGIDDRLYAASIDRSTHHLWTAHAIGVNSSGMASSPTRNGARWYDIDPHGDTGTPTLAQSGTVFDPATTNPLFYWVPTVVTTGEGITAIGGSVAGATAYADTWFSGRLPTDAAGQLDAPSTYTATAFAYNPNDGSTPHRWGDYSLTRVDPDDDQTIWTIQEYTAGTNAWGVKIARLQAPPPATPSAATPATVSAGATGIGVMLDGASTGGSQNFDPGDGFAKRLAASVGCGVKVAHIAVSSPTRLALTLDTTGAVPGPCGVTVTNPDGQTASAANLLTVESPLAPTPTPTPPTPSSSPTPTPKPGPTVKIAKTGKRGRAKFTVTCSSACKGSVGVTIPAKTAKKLGLGKKRTVAKKRFSLSAAGKRTFTVRLTAKVRKALKREHVRTLRTQVTVKVKDAAGQAAKPRRNVKIRR